MATSQNWKYKWLCLEFLTCLSVLCIADQKKKKRFSVQLCFVPVNIRMRIKPLSDAHVLCDSHKDIRNLWLNTSHCKYTKGAFLTSNLYCFFVSQVDTKTFSTSCQERRFVWHSTVGMSCFGACHDRQFGLLLLIKKM